MKYEHRHNIIIESEPETLLKAILNFKPMEVNEQWISELKEKKILKCSKNHKFTFYIKDNQYVIISLPVNIKTIIKKNI